MKNVWKGSKLWIDDGLWVQTAALKFLSVSYVSRNADSAVSFTSPYLCIFKEKDDVLIEDRRQVGHSRAQLGWGTGMKIRLSVFFTSDTMQTPRAECSSAVDFLSDGRQQRGMTFSSEEKEAERAAWQRHSSADVKDADALSQSKNRMIDQLAACDDFTFSDSSFWFNGLLMQRVLTWAQSDALLQVTSSLV